MEMDGYETTRDVLQSTSSPGHISTQHYPAAIMLLAISAYPYQQLDRSKKDFRLLQILPFANSRADRIPFCRMYHSSLTERPVHEELSMHGDQDLIFRLSV